MPTRTLTADGRTWRVFPSGFVTPYTADEFGLIFVSGEGDQREVRVTRFSPVADSRFAHGRTTLPSRSAARSSSVTVSATAAASASS